MGEGLTGSALSKRRITHKEERLMLPGSLCSSGGHEMAALNKCYITD